MEPVFLPYQQRWASDRSPVRVAEKSRRIGWTWSQSALSVLDAARTSGEDQFYVGYNYVMARDFIDDCAEWARLFSAGCSEIDEYVIEDEKKDILTFEIRFASGHRITALTSRPSSLRGKQGHVIIDEAAFHDDLAGLIKAAMAFLMWGGRVSIISTHNGVENPFNELCERIRSGRINYSLHRVTLDDALSEGLYKRICLRLGREWSADAENDWRDELVGFYQDGADEELFCVPSRSGGVYLARSLIESRMIDAPVVRLGLKDEFALRPERDRQADVEQWCERVLRPLLDALPRHLVHFLGEDFGRISDLTVLAPITITQQLMRRVPFLVELRNVPYDQQKQVLLYVLRRLPKFGGAALDATGNGQFLAETAWQHYGDKIVEMVQLNDAWYAENLPKFKAAFEDAAIEVPRDADVLQDLGHLQVLNGIPKLPKTKTADTKTKGKKRHGDAAIALALGHYASRVLGEKVGYRAVRQEDYGDRRRVRATHGIRSRKGLL